MKRSVSNLLSLTVVTGIVLGVSLLLIAMVGGAVFPHLSPVSYGGASLDQRIRSERSWYAQRPPLCLLLLEFQSGSVPGSSILVQRVRSILEQLQLLGWGG